ncbi:MAG: hypothetical protein HRU14_07275 [Planctomycetes bacterium]|nr:hypothetical protein [Planctomycetota bacterium]
MRYLILAALTVSLFLSAGCTGSAPSGGSDRGQPPTGGARPLTLPHAGNDGPRQGDFRVILHQANGTQTMIMVNRGHTLRKAPEGRRRLALNIPGHGYKLLRENAMGALLKSLEERNFSALATPFKRGDERWFDAQAKEPRYRGMIFVERDGDRKKVLGFRPAGINDAVGQRRYKAFVDLKLVCMNWFVSTTDTEVPRSGTLRR